MTETAFADALARAREESDTYPVVFHVNDRWRVIACRDGIQWIVQQRRGHRDGEPRWQGRSFCVERAGLLQVIEDACGPLSALTRASVPALPARFPRGEFEHQGLPVIATASRFPDGEIAELFLDAGKVGSAAHVAAKDAAIIASICLQHGVPAPALLHSLEKNRDGSPAGIVGVALSLFSGGGA
jgi:hypothetical protein